MPLARTGVLVGLFIGLIAVTLQNQSPAFSLVFLGMRSQPLPLGIWIVGALVLGIAIGLLLLFILNLTGTTGTPIEGPRPAPRRSRTGRKPAAAPRASAPRASTTTSDWDVPPSNDWGSGDSTWAARPTPQPEPDLEDFGSIDEQRYARAGGAAPSTYSHSAQDPNFAKQAGQRESVFEAEYRMVKPPGQAAPPQDPQEDWDELNDDFFDED